MILRHHRTEIVCGGALIIKESKAAVLGVRSVWISLALKRRFLFPKNFIDLLD